MQMEQTQKIIVNDVNVTIDLSPHSLLMWCFHHIKTISGISHIGTGRYQTSEVGTLFKACTVGKHSGPTEGLSVQGY